MPWLLYDAELQPAVSKLIKQGRPARVVAPSWGSKALEVLGIKTGDLMGRLQVICNLFAESTDPAVIKRLIKRGADVRFHQHVHAKVYFNQKKAIVGSANVSGIAFYGYKSATNFELCAELQEPRLLDELSQWWACLWEAATPLELGTEMTARLFEAAEYMRDQSPKARTLQEAVTQSPGIFANVFVRVDFFNLPDAVAKRTRCKTEALGDHGIEVGAWAEWFDMPPQAEIISYVARKLDGTVYFDGIWLSPTSTSKPDDLNAIYVTGIPNIKGYALAPKTQWLSAARAYQRDLIDAKAEDGGLLPLPEFVDRYLSVRDPTQG
jgi:hypothetical protein